MILSFRDADTQELFEHQTNRRWGSIQSVAIRKLDYIDQAATLNDLKSPPGNHLEQLSGDRKGQHSIRINRQYRICFIWNEGAHNAEIADYY